MAYEQNRLLEWQRKGRKLQFTLVGGEAKLPYQTCAPLPNVIEQAISNPKRVSLWYQIEWNEILYDWFQDVTIMYVGLNIILCKTPNGGLS